MIKCTQLKHQRFLSINDFTIDSSDYKRNAWHPLIQLIFVSHIKVTARIRYTTRELHHYRFCHRVDLFLASWVLNEAISCLLYSAVGSVTRLANNQYRHARSTSNTAPRTISFERTFSNVRVVKARSLKAQ